MFRALEPELVVPAETGPGEEESSVPQGQAHVGQRVRLLELEGVQVVRDRIVGCVLKVCSCQVGKIGGLAQAYRQPFVVGSK